MKVAIRYTNPRGRNLKCTPVLHVVNEEGDELTFVCRERASIRDAQYVMRELVAGTHELVEQYGSDCFVESDIPQVEDLDG